MLTIGRIFLEAYNEKNGTSYDAKKFFIEVYYPLFFDSTKYLQWVQNSPFVQGLRSTEKGYGVETFVKKYLSKTIKIHINLFVII